MIGIDFTTYDIETGQDRRTAICQPCHDEGPPLPWHMHPRNPQVVNHLERCEHPSHGRHAQAAKERGE